MWKLQVLNRYQYDLTMNSCFAQDFVRLAKWEDRGYYAMKVITERNQRQLHRLTRRADQALSEPAAAVLAAASKAMGFADLTMPDGPVCEGRQDAVDGKTKASNHKKRKGSKLVSAEDAAAQAQVRLHDQALLL